MKSVTLSTISPASAPLPAMSFLTSPLSVWRSMMGGETDIVSKSFPRRERLEGGFSGQISGSCSDLARLRSPNRLLLHGQRHA